MARVMILGSGGREHALASWFSQHWHRVFVAPGNGGTGDVESNIRVDLADFDAVAYATKRNSIDLLVVGPEAPLVGGIVDYWKAKCIDKQGTKIFGPGKDAALLEGSKIYAREFANRHRISIPKFAAFKDDDFGSNMREAKDYLERVSSRGEKPLLVVKSDGLCSGKGVFVNDNIEDAMISLGEMKRFSGSSPKILLEEKLVGEEATVTVVTDGDSYKMFPHSQDHKRRFDGDKGPNTGGMGAYAPTKLIDLNLEKKIEKDIIVPTIEGMKKEGLDYAGVLYFSVMVSKGKPYLIEYNCRFGDPEAQAIIPFAESDPYRLMVDCIDGTLDKSDFRLKSGYSCCVVMVDKDYPEGKSVGEEILLDNRLSSMPDVRLYHSGTLREGRRLLTNGGRILGVTATSAESHAAAVGRAYDAAKLVDFKGCDYRKDIAHRVLDREKEGI